MNADILGYLAYVLIGLFYPLQLFFMFRGKNVNLGSWPLISLTAGLVTLQASFLFVPFIPAYVVWGNLVNTGFALINLFYVLKSRAPATTRRSSTLERYAEKMLSLSIPMSKFVPRLKNRTTPFTEQVNFCSVERDDSLREGHFAPCETCGCTLLLRDAFPVEHIVFDAQSMYAGRRAPRHEDVLPTEVKFYCKRDKLPYERVVVTPSLGEHSAQFDYYVARRRPQYSDDNACAYIGDRVDGWWQVTEDGEQFD